MNPSNTSDRNGLNKSSDTLDTMPPAMSLLNNSSDTVKLARELRHKRDQLEELMKKNVFTTGVNESLDNSRNQMRVKVELQRIYISGLVENY